MVDKASLPAASHGLILYQILNTSTLSARVLFSAPARLAKQHPSINTNTSAPENIFSADTLPHQNSKLSHCLVFYSFSVLLAAGDLGFVGGFQLPFQRQRFLSPNGQKEPANLRQSSLPNKVTNPNTRAAFRPTHATPQTHTLLTPADTPLPCTTHTSHTHAHPASCTADTTHSTRRAAGSQQTQRATQAHTTARSVTPAGARSDGWRRTV